MSTDNKAIFAHFQDVLNSGDLEAILPAIEDLSAPDLVFHGPVTGGVDDLKQTWTMLLRTYPDIHVTIEDLIAEGDKVVARNTVTGTNTGPFRDLPATGKSVNYNEIFIMRFVDGRIAEIWGVADLYAQMKQLGLIST
jgi:steroid delta-isomerase-like uncharacterized protein